MIPESTNPLDVAALLKCYLQMLPEPLLTFSVYSEFREAGGNVRQLSDLLRTIPYAHYSTLECLTSLLNLISQKSMTNKVVGSLWIEFEYIWTFSSISRIMEFIIFWKLCLKMDAHSLAFELAPCLLWKQNKAHIDSQVSSGLSRSPFSSRAQDSDIRGELKRTLTNHVLYICCDKHILTLQVIYHFRGEALELFMQKYKLGLF